jgi:DNA-binding transcriptional MocR family regulator
VADQRLVENRVDGGPIRATPLGVPVHTDPRRRTFCSGHCRLLAITCSYRYNIFNVPIRYRFKGRTARDIASSIERGVREGALEPGGLLPPVRRLAEDLAVSPGTVASAYAVLRTRGVVSADGRRGTRVRRRPPLQVSGAPAIPEGVRDLASGNPDPRLLPSVTGALGHIDAASRLYGRSPDLSELVAEGRARLDSEGVPPGALTMVSGALDGVERVLQAHLSPGDRVAVEDPGYGPALDLLAALGMEAVPVRTDGRGLVPADLTVALTDRPRALLITPRAQNPTGASLDRARSAQLRAVLRTHPDTLVIEDDHAGPVSGSPLHTVVDRGMPRWAFVHSVSKSLGPDLRLALLAGDETTVSRVAGRRLVGAGWVSHVLQQLVLALWRNPATDALLARAAETYRRRREALLHALGRAGIEGFGSSGLNVWIPVAEEGRTVQALLASGWAVRPGEPFRLQSPPGIRVTTASLPPKDAPAFARDMVRSLAPPSRTRSA